jgi:hypothetical protein
MSNHLPLFEFKCAARAAARRRVHDIGVRVQHEQAFVGLDPEVVSLPLRFPGPDRVNHALNEYGRLDRLGPQAPQCLNQRIGADHIEDRMRGAAQRDKVGLLDDF